MATLAQIYDRHKGDNTTGWGDKGTVHSYIEVYEKLLEPCRHTAKKMLEIGILTGESLRMWEEYFDKSEVHGIDGSDQPLGGRYDLRPMIAEGTHHIHLLDATDMAQVWIHFEGMLFDVIIEDADHDLWQQLALYKLFKRHLAPGGIYVIEDVKDLDQPEVRASLEAIDPGKTVKIIDLRGNKGRFDDVLVVIQ
jgi:SAM-dependent methyltransferase